MLTLVVIALIAGFILGVVGAPAVLAVNLVSKVARLSAKVDSSQEILLDHLDATRTQSRISRTISWISRSRSRTLEGT